MAKKTTARVKTTSGSVMADQPDRGARALVPKPNELIVRMYRQGLGDCFLLALPAEASRTKYVLIDCGVHKRQTDGPARLAQVMDDLVAATGARIDVVVATHEHADHLSGFVQRGSPFLKNALTIGEAWLAWTEKRGDRQADTLRRKRGAAQRLIDRAVEEARTRAGRGLDGSALAGRIDELTDFDRPAEGSVDLDDLEARVSALRPSATLTVTDDTATLGAAKMARKKSRPSSNELALTLLALTVGDNNAAYCEPGTVREIEGVPHFRAYVLGPPRSDLLEKEKPTKIRGAKDGDSGGVYKEVYLTATGSNRALALSPRFGLDESTGGARVPDDWRFPFAARYHRPYTLEAASDPGSGDTQARDRIVWDAERPAPDVTRAFIDEAYLAPESTWRRIDGDWLQAAGTLALDLAGDTNNTSLALAFEWGPPGKGRVLLFAADAQVGNWLSWRDQPYGDAKVKVEDLLHRVLIYKVGHHGSHNATARRDSRDTSSTDPLGVPFGLELMNDIIAMIPVDYDAVRKEMPDPWKMPHEPLYRRLREKARRRVLRSDLALEPLDSRRDEKDVVPAVDAWKAVPGLAGVRWRCASQTDFFENGTEGPLYYDVAIALRG
jgi:hypothetical protein